MLFRVLGGCVNRYLYRLPYVMRNKFRYLLNIAEIAYEVCPFFLNRRKGAAYPLLAIHTIAREEEPSSRNGRGARRDNRRDGEGDPYLTPAD